MIPPSGDNSDVLFKRLLILSLLVYSIFALFIEMIPYTPKIIKGPVKPQRIVKLTEISVKEPKLTDEQKRQQEERRLAEERRLTEERRKQELERQRLEDQKRSEEERRRRMEAQKRSEEEKRLADERKRIEEQKRLEEEKRLAEERQRLEEQKQLKEEKRLAEEQRRTEEQKRLEEQKRAADEQRRIEEEKRQEEKKRLTEEQQRMEQQKRQEEERRVAEERQRIEEQKRLEEEKHVAEERRRIEEQKRLDEEKRLTEERQRIEEQKRMEEEKRLAEERRHIEEQKRIEEERRLAKEKNREAAKSSGLLKTMKGGKPADDIIEDKEISSVLSAPADKLIQSPHGKPQSTGPQERTPVQKAAPPSTKGTEKGLKGSEGIGDISEILAIKTPSSGLSGERGITDIEIKQVDGGGGGGGSGAGGGDTSVVHPRRNQESIKAVVATHRGSLDFIYKKTLRNNPTLRGVVIIEFTIAANGDVTGGRIASSTVKDPSFEDQVLKRILTWKFPPLPDSGNTIVSFPIEFSPV